MIISAGNDIVDLEAINAERTNSPAFYSKIITGTEKELYNNQPQLSQIPFEQFVWLLWSVKESVYKFMQRHNAGLVFSPSKINATEVNIPVGSITAGNSPAVIEHVGFAGFSTIDVTVNHHSDIYYTHSLISRQYISTVASNQNHFQNVYWGVKLIDRTDHNHQSEMVREFILSRLSSIFNSNLLKIVKSQSGCPVLFDNEVETATPVSLAHHGNWVAYSFGG